MLQIALSAKFIPQKIKLHYYFLRLNFIFMFQVHYLPYLFPHFKYPILLFNAKVNHFLHLALKFIPLDFLNHHYYQ